MLEKVKEALNVKKKRANREEMETIELIEDMLNDDGCFLKTDMELALNMLRFVGYDKTEAKEVYIKLMVESLQILRGKYQLIDLE